MTGHQQRIHDAVEQGWIDHGKCPSRAELSTMTGFASGTVRNALTDMALQENIVRVGHGCYMTPEHYEIIVDAIRQNHA